MIRALHVTALLSILFLAIDIFFLDLSFSYSENLFFYVLPSIILAAFLSVFAGKIQKKKSRSSLENIVLFSGAIFLIGWLLFFMSAIAPNGPAFDFIAFNGPWLFSGFTVAAGIVVVLGLVERVSRY